MEMEQLNKVQLLGIVGRCDVSTVADRTMARISLATNHAYKDRNGDAVIETIWHNLVAFEGPRCRGVGDLSRGDWLRVEGRLRYASFTDGEGNTLLRPEVLVQKLERVREAACERTN